MWQLYSSIGVKKGGKVFKKQKWKFNTFNKNVNTVKNGRKWWVELIYLLIQYYEFWVPKLSIF